jgi:hypothetical protein
MVPNTVQILHAISDLHSADINAGTFQCKCVSMANTGDACAKETHSAPMEKLKKHTGITQPYRMMETDYDGASHCSGHAVNAVHGSHINMMQTPHIF